MLRAYHVTRDRLARMRISRAFLSEAEIHLLWLGLALMEARKDPKHESDHSNGDLLALNTFSFKLPASHNCKYLPLETSSISELQT